MTTQKVLILDFGGEYAQVLARHVRALHVFCEVQPHTLSLEDIKEKKPVGIFLAASAEELEQSDSPTQQQDFLALNIPTLAVEYQRHPLTEDAKKALEQAVEQKKEEFPASVLLDPDSMRGALGERLFSHFLFDLCGAKADWTMEAYAAFQLEEIKKKVGDGKVLLALSGGVDSSVLASLLSKAIGNQLTCILVDHGLMRKNEPNEVEAAFKDSGMNFIRVDAGQRFLGRLAGVTDPEEKRKIIGEEFIRVFEEEAAKLGTVDFLAQGTIYPDVIESGIGGEMVKSHHNVGGLPENVDFKDIIEPLRPLFKDEVRALGTILGVPEYLVWRQPFPGPGLGIRIIGEITPEKVAILQNADAIFREEIATAALDRKIGQYFAVLTNMRSVGFRDNRRTYDYTVALRAVSTDDFMVAEWYPIPFPLLEKISSRLSREVKHVGRVVYDISSKPPATIEWE